jgi:hypothetical protein
MFTERMHDLWLRIRALIQRRKLDHDLGEELEFHLATSEQKLIEQGMAPQEARYALAGPPLLLASAPPQPAPPKIVSASWQNLLFTS